MRKSSFFSKTSSLLLAFAFVAGLLIWQPISIVSEASAENYHNRASVTRSGVRLGKHKYKHQIHYKKNVRRDRFVNKRQREINRRNARVEAQNAERRLRASTRRSGPNGRFLNRNERDALLNGVIIGPEIITVTQGGGIISNGGAICPAGHNCGYRIYSDGTGPRIITPGLGAGNGLPNYDGLNGPKIITLD